MERERPKILTLSDSAISIRMGSGIDIETNNRVHALRRAIEGAHIKGITETVPSYCSLAVYYDMLTLAQGELIEAIAPVIDELDSAEKTHGGLISIPVLYGGEWGEDLPFVAKHCSMSESEVIALHVSREYPVYMLGFLPGFCYLGGMDERLATPRLTTPRVRIEAGSVGIAGEQTGIYPLASPGGWQIIGRTPLKIYDPHRESPTLIEAGMKVRFYSVDRAEYERILCEQEAR